MDNGSRPKPINPAVFPNNPLLFCPQPNMNPSKTSFCVKVNVSLAKNPTVNEESPYWIPYTQFDEEQPGLFPVADLRPEQAVEVHEMLEYVFEADGSKIGCCWA